MAAPLPDASAFPSGSYCWDGNRVRQQQQGRPDRRAGERRRGRALLAARRRGPRQVTDLSTSHLSEPPGTPVYGPTLYNSQANDDGCKHNVGSTVTPVRQNRPLGPTSTQRCSSTTPTPPPPRGGRRWRSPAGSTTWGRSSSTRRDESDAVVPHPYCQRHSRPQQTLLVRRISSDSGRTRTCYPRLRRPVLYPDELRSQTRTAPITWFRDGIPPSGRPGSRRSDRAADSRGGGSRWHPPSRPG